MSERGGQANIVAHIVRNDCNRLFVGVVVVGWQFLARLWDWKRVGDWFAVFGKRVLVCLLLHCGAPSNEVAALIAARSFNQKVQPKFRRIKCDIISIKIFECYFSLTTVSHAQLHIVAIGFHHVLRSIAAQAESSVCVFVCARASVDSVFQE